MSHFFAPGALWNNLRLTLGVLPLVVEVRLSLWREPFPAFAARWKGLVEDDLQEARKLHPSTQGEPDDATRRDAWNAAFAVSRAARLVPRASCLTQALVLQRVLARQGQDCALRLGVDRSGAKTPSARRSPGFEAHAWIEWHGRVLIGGDVSRWTPFVMNTPSTEARATE